MALQDMTADDFEVSEDNTPQKSTASSTSSCGRAGRRKSASEPASVTAANELAADPRRRVFVVYLDIEHVGFEGSHSIKEPLIDLLRG